MGYLASLLNTVGHVSYNGQARKRFVYGQLREMHRDETPVLDFAPHTYISQ